MRTNIIPQAIFSLLRALFLGILCFFHLFGFTLFAQSGIKPKFEYISSDDGLSENQIRTIFQDRHGFIWIGTDDGLNRYDGYSFKTYRHDPDDANSLQGLRINSVLEDSQGDLWIRSGGDKNLNRLDRATGKFERLEHNPDDPYSISSSQSSFCFEDSHNNIWVGTDNGLNRYDRATDKFERFQHDPDDPNSIGGKGVQGMFEDSRGYLWISSGGLTRLELATGKIKRFPHDPDNPNSLSSNNVLKALSVQAVLEDSQGNIWFGTDNGVNRYDPIKEQFERFQHDPQDPYSLSKDWVQTIFEDKHKNLWVGTKNGLNRLDHTNEKFQRFQHDSNNSKTICHNVIQDIFEDKKGNLWITTGGGIAVMDSETETFDCFQKNRGITSVLPDNSGNFWLNLGWIGGLGMSRMDLVSANIQHFQHDPVNHKSLTDNAVYPIIEDSDGYVWAGVIPSMGNYLSSGGLDRLDRATGNFEHFQHDRDDPNSIANNEVFSVFEDSEGHLWVGYNGGGVLDRLNRKTGKVERRYHQDQNDPTTYDLGAVVCILEDPEGNLWFGGSQGINKLDKTTGLFHYYQPFPDGNWMANFVESMIMDSEGYLWAGTWFKGLCRLDPRTGTFEYFEHDPDKPNTISSNAVWALHEDSKKNIWLGTGFGLNRWDPNTRKFIHYFEKDGLPNPTILGIQEDDHGRLWISTRKGISRFDPQLETFRNFDVHDGLQGNQFTIFSHYKSLRSGELFFGGSNGFNIFHPDSMKIDTFTPPVAISSFLHYNRNESQPILDDFIADKEKITLSHHDNNLTFEFAALNFRKTAKTQYKYQLTGFSDQWYELGNKREVNFTNLRPGNYILRVMAANGDGVWNPEPAELAIKVQPPWWWNFWTKLVYLLLVMGLLFGLYRVMLNRKLTLVEARQLKEMDAIKTKFYTNITHEFRTPLTVIQGMSDQVIEKAEELTKEKIKDNVRIVKRNSAQLLNMVDQMLDLRRLESGSLPVNLVKGDVLQYLRYLTESFYSYAADRGVGLHFMTDLDQLVIDYDEDKLLHIVSNLLSNAIKFTPEGGNVYFRCERRETGGENGVTAPDILELHFKDTGVGISEEQIPFIFDRFYQADQNTTRKGEGTGIGLALTRELVRLLKGTIEVKSRMEYGTTFILTLPISREAVEAPAEQLSLEDKMLGFTAPKPFREDHSKTPVNGKDMPLALVIEDNPDVVRYLSSCLEGNYKVVTAMDGQTGVDIALDSIPDIIVSDVMMPEKDGYEVCQILKDDERTSHIPLILLTAKADRKSRITGLKAGADAYLAKPFNREELQVRLEKLIEIRKKIQERYSNLQSPAEKDLRTIEDTFLDKVKKVILERISDSEFGQLEICRALGLSRSQLFRKLKALTGKSTSLVVRSIRLEQARQLLQNSDLNVSEVAYEVGFKDRAFFSRLFTEEYGEPPSSLRT